MSHLTSHGTKKGRMRPRAKLKAGDVPQVTPDGMYSIGAVVGTGAQGIVFLGREISSGLLVAIKVCHSDRVSQTLREAEALRMLRHPNILSIRACSVSMEKNMTFLVFELCSGGELFNKIAQAPLGYFPEQVCCYYFRSLMSATAYMHAKGVAHRDIKPENLLLTASHELRISDFGLSRISVPVTKEEKDDNKNAETIQTDKDLSTTFCGSLYYMAPEVRQCVWQPAPYSPQCADIWSCGVVLHVMLTGSLPWNEATGNDPNYNDLLNGDHEYPSDLSIGAREALTACLQPDPEERLTAAEILELPWVNSSFAKQVPEQAMNILAGTVSGNPADRPTKGELIQQGWLLASKTDKNHHYKETDTEDHRFNEPTSASAEGCASAAADATGSASLAMDATLAPTSRNSRPRESISNDDAGPKLKRQRTDLSSSTHPATEKESRPEMHVGHAIAALGWHAIKKKPVSVRDAVKEALESLGLRAIVQHSKNNTEAEIFVLGNDSSDEGSNVVSEDVPMAEWQRNDLICSGDIVCVVRVLDNGAAGNQIHISKPQGEMFAFHNLYKRLRRLLGDVNNGAQ